MRIKKEVYIIILLGFIVSVLSILIRIYDLPFAFVGLLIITTFSLLYILFLAVVKLFIGPKNQRIYFFVPLVLGVILWYIIPIVVNVVIGLQLRYTFEKNRTYFNKIVSKVDKEFSLRRMKENFPGNIEVYIKGNEYNVLFYINKGTRNLYDALLYNSGESILLNEKDIVKKRIDTKWSIIFGDVENRY